jgi:hypothetical protein
LDALQPFRFACFGKGNDDAHGSPRKAPQIFAPRLLTFFISLRVKSIHRQPAEKFAMMLIAEKLLSNGLLGIRHGFRV